MTGKIAQGDIESHGSPGMGEEADRYEVDSKGTSTGQVRVLSVDDDPTITAVVDRILSRSGHTCTKAESAEEALAVLDHESFELLISDINMPGASGLELLRQVKEHDPDLAVIMVSALDDPSVAETALDIGAFGYVVKPFEVTELQISVSNALRRRELEIAHRDHLSELEERVQRRTVELTLATDELRVSEEYFRSLTHASPMGILYIDHDGACEYANSKARELVGREGTDLDGYRWMSDMSSADAAALRDLVRRAQLGETDAELEYRIVGVDGSAVWVRSQVAPVTNDLHGISGALIIFEDVTTGKELEAKLRYHASHDHLTGLPNRRELRLQLDRRLSELSDGEKIALLMIDLDHFKLVNDTHGHQVGDELIATVGERLTKLAVGGTLAARLGGDEFVAVVSGRDRGELVTTAESVRSYLTRPTKVAGVRLSLNLSVGMAIADDPMPTASELMRGADIAMQRAKHQGDSVVVYDSETARGVARRLAVTSSLRQAVDEQRLTAQYQPVVDAQTGRLVGLEALARWTDPDLGRVGPDEFIPLAESVGLVHRIDERIFSLATTQLREWQTTGQVDPHVFMSVNLSASQLSNEALPDLVATALDRVGLDPHCLCLEMTEGALIQDLKRTFPILQQLRDIGVRIAIDDFGVGHSSLSYLTQLPVDILKVDRSFITALGDQSRDMVKTIVDLAHRFDLDVIAEGVEDVQQLDTLASLDCDMIQGYFTGRPADPTDPTLLDALAESDGLSHSA